MGNICRSPLAEGVLANLADRDGVSRQLTIDSAGTGHWHVGEPPDRRAQAVARRYGVEIGHCRARQVTRDDFRRFTHVVALDDSVRAALERLRPAGGTAELRLLLDYVDGRAGEGVADPYYGGPEGFEITWADVTRGAAALARRIAAAIAAR